jgi:type II secretory pathway predicted ATPase ExeA
MGIGEDRFIYTDHFGLNALPFENVPDPAFFFDQGDYSRVLEHLTGCLKAGRGLMMVVGPIGSGKTTLSQRLLLAVPANTRLAWLTEPPEDNLDLFLLLLQQLGGEPPTSQGRAFLLRDLRDRLLDLHTKGGHCLTLIDEAHKASDEMLEAVRLLNNLEHGAHKLVQIILLGQDELLKRLSEPALRPFKQRIAALEVIGKMDPGQVRDYILHRLEVAGGRDQVFTDEAIEAIARSTGGIPRVTNSLCDRALMASFGHGGKQVDIKDVTEAGRLMGDRDVDRTLFFYFQERDGRPYFQEREGLEQQGGASPQPPSSGLGFNGRPEHLFEERRAPAALLIPLVCLFSSVCLFVASLWFYCSRAGSEDCFERLLGFLA